LGGAEIQPFASIRSGSQFRYNADNGAMRVDASDNSITFQFINRAGSVIDSHTMTKTAPPPPPPPPTSATNLIPAGSTWKYLDTGVTPASTWTTLNFDDAAWKSGPAQLGYGDGDEKTVVSYGPSASSKYITTRFRKTFAVADSSKVASVTMKLLRDDGAIVYLNGAEVYRSNMPGGAITGSTLASAAQRNPHGTPRR
jgi:hypothetical protein